MKGYIFLILSALAAVRCGVSGRPLPPETPAPIGRGEPSFRKATEKIRVPQRKKTINTMTDDWNEPQDFQEREGQ